VPTLRSLYHPIPAENGNIDSLVVTGDGRPRTQAYLSAGTAWYQSYQMVLLRLRAHRNSRLLLPCAVERPAWRIQVETAHHASLPERPDYQTIGDSSETDGEKFADGN
jgi:hypothetical protein